MFKQDQGKAPSSAMTRDRRRDRSVDELIGICRGILADGSVNVSEGGFLLDWLERHREFIDTFPFSALYPRVRDALVDGVLDADEEKDLLDALQGAVGGEIEPFNGANSLSTELPFDVPCPSIVHSDHIFVVTGTFEYGKRSHVKATIEARQGIVRPAVSHKTNYVIVGAVGSRDWMHSSFGRKIETAAGFREAGARIAIVSEQDWARAL